MQHKIGFISGVIGGLGKYLLEINVSFENRLWQAVITAFICGIAGIIGKDVYVFIKKKVRQHVGKN